MLHVTNESKVSERTADALVRIEENFQDLKETFIRSLFNTAVLDYSALAVIQFAEKEGYTEMAEEMKADYYAVTGKEVENGN